MRLYPSFLHQRKKGFIRERGGKKGLIIARNFSPSERENILVLKREQNNPEMVFEDKKDQRKTCRIGMPDYFAEGKLAAVFSAIKITADRPRFIP